MPLTEAVERHRAHFEDGVVQCERGVDNASMDALENLGYNLNRWSIRSMFFGGAHVVAPTEDGKFEGKGDRRRGGFVARG
jgi:gamma-glutamyltranspeptidase/glutathione hydrolase